MPPVTRHLLHQLTGYYLSGPRWWLPLCAGTLYSLVLPPFNHETHWTLALFPFFTFFVLLPLAAFAVQPSLKRAVFHTFLYGYAAAFGQFHWLVFDNVAGLWHYVIIGLFIISALVGSLYCAAGMLFRAAFRVFPYAYIIIFPALWVLIDYSRTLGECAFPWAFLGYSLTPVLPLAQTASITGVWGLTYIVVMGNMLAWQSLRTAYRGGSFAVPRLLTGIFFIFLIAASIVGWLRMRNFRLAPRDMITVSLLQPNIDQFHWSNAMLEPTFTVCESLIVKASEQKPDLMILPESALLCFISHHRAYEDRLAGVIRRVRTPLVFGSLDWEQSPPGSSYEQFVYNTAFFIDSGAGVLKPYHKIKLVPFSESLPLEGLFPLLSRVNLGEADFHRGSEQTVFTAGKAIRAGPFICYESIFPDFVRRRAKRGINCMVNVTNDGWFGKSSGPYHHAMMARMRSIENGVSLARCANSGISMFVDPVGAISGRTSLYQKAILTRAVTLRTLPTFYEKFGDWFVAICTILFGFALMAAVLKKRARRAERHVP